MQAAIQFHASELNSMSAAVSREKFSQAEAARLKGDIDGYTMQFEDLKRMLQNLHDASGTIKTQAETQVRAPPILLTSCLPDQLYIIELMRQDGALT